MPRKSRHLKADLRKTDFRPARQKGSQVIWQHERYRDITVNLALGDGDDARYYQEDTVRDAIAAIRDRDDERQS